jgi:hypothetical protein
MKGERLYAVVGNPGALITRTRSNKNSNVGKANRIALGTGVQKRKRELGEDHETALRNAVDTRPKKAARLTRATAAAEAKAAAAAAA